MANCPGSGGETTVDDGLGAALKANRKACERDAKGSAVDVSFVI